MTHPAAYCSFWYLRVKTLMLLGKSTAWSYLEEVMESVRLQVTLKIIFISLRSFISFYNFSKKSWCERPFLKTQWDWWSLDTTWILPSVNNWNSTRIFVNIFKGIESCTHPIRMRICFNELFKVSWFNIVSAIFEMYNVRAFPSLQEYKNLNWAATFLSAFFQGLFRWYSLDLVFFIASKQITDLFDIW